MAAQKGHKKAGGREKGTENKATKDIKAAYKQLIEDNLENLTKWLEQIAMDDPAKAVNIMFALSEYVIPKLARTETDVTSKGEQVQLPTIQFVRTNDKDK